VATLGRMSNTREPWTRKPAMTGEAPTRSLTAENDTGYEPSRSRRWLGGRSATGRPYYTAAPLLLGLCPPVHLPAVPSTACMRRGRRPRIAAGSPSPQP
jgi:hypothetical protein